jgi:hypothetical protein
MPPFLATAALDKIQDYNQRHHRNVIYRPVPPSHLASVCHRQTEPVPFPTDNLDDGECSVLLETPRVIGQDSVFFVFFSTDWIMLQTCYLNHDRSPTTTTKPTVGSRPLPFNY